MAPLPPVRKRTDYSDVSSDDLAMALFFDRINGTAPASPPNQPAHAKPVARYTKGTKPRRKP